MLARNEAVDMVASEAEWEPVRVHMVERALEEHPQAVAAFEASYTSYTDGELEAQAETLLATHATVLVTKTMDNDEAALICWERAVSARGERWSRERAVSDETVTEVAD